MQEENNNIETEHSESIKNLVSAMCKVWEVLEPAKKTKTNPFYNSKYEDLTEIFDVCREPLVKNGLVIFQTTSIINQKSYLTTRLMHTSGEWIKGVYPLVATNQVKQEIIEGNKTIKQTSYIETNDPQSYATAVTYARRVTIKAIIGMSVEDDDGNKASGNDDKNKEGATYPKKQQSGSDNIDTIVIIKNKLTAAFGQDEQKKGDVIQNITTFPATDEKTGEPIIVKGKRDLDKMRPAQLKVVANNIDNEIKKYQSKE